MLISVLQQAAVTSKGMSYIDEKKQTIFFSYKELLESASSFLAGLQSSGLNPGDKVILAVDNNLEFVISFWGCVVGGIVPTLVQAPIFLTHDAAFQKLHHVWEILEKPVVIISSKQLSEQLQQRKLPIDTLLQYDTLCKEEACNDYYESKQDDVAVIQFSSGSTTLPKGVVLSHKNVLSNIQACKESLEISPHDKCLSWMPLFHDMGLIGFHLTPIYSKCDHLLMPTLMFAQSPLSWLKMVSEYKATITCMTNFATTLISKKIGDRSENWDLSCVRVVLNGSEPINVKLLRIFIEKMAAYQLPRTAVLPVYGLAEATLAVTMPNLKSELVIERLNREDFIKHRAVSAKDWDATAIEVVSEGSAISEYQVRIVDSEDKILADGFIGHIQVYGESVSRGYCDNPAATDKMFCDSWLRTGDLGFIRNHCLFVTGRTKDLLFVGGRNYYAHDLENIILQNKKFEDCEIAVCGDKCAEGDHIILFMKVNKFATTQLFFEMGNYLKNQAGLLIAKMILTKHPFPRTSSGKLQRYKLVELYHSGAFASEIEEWEKFLNTREQKRSPQTATEKILWKLWSLELATNDISVNDHFSDLGGKSYHAMKIMSQLSDYYNITIAADVFFRYPTISQLAACIDSSPTITSVKSNLFSG
ncbi:AMP-binding protein [Candidatus Uabimicrobium sp. HlEnr_7]|uniref:non-ribosomal peptide synthetase n=1 Tax=Candidatus Uabimicrobium helgolandensis TaxID=3095367 RepID=UPI003557B403